MDLQIVFCGIGLVSLAAPETEFGPKEINHSGIAHPAHQEPLGKALNLCMLIKTGILRNCSHLRYLFCAEFLMLRRTEIFGKINGQQRRGEAGKRE